MNTFTYDTKDIIVLAQQNIYLTAKKLNTNTEKANIIPTLNFTEDASQDEKIVFKNLLKYIENACNEIKIQLYDYITSPEDGKEDIKKQIVFNLRLPSNFNQASIPILNQLINNTLVNYVTLQWLTTITGTKDESLEKDILQSLVNIKQLANRRCRPYRQPKTIDICFVAKKTPTSSSM